jgi:hypothetical protein
MTQTAVTVGCSEEFPREAAMRWDQMKWEKIQHSKNMASDWQVKSLLPRSTGGLPVPYRHSLCSALWTISVSNLKLPPPACPGTTCTDMMDTCKFETYQYLSYLPFKLQVELTNGLKPYFHLYVYNSRCQSIVSPDRALWYIPMCHLLYQVINFGAGYLSISVIFMGFLPPIGHPTDHPVSSAVAVSRWCPLLSQEVLMPKAPKSPPKPRKGGERIGKWAEGAQMWWERVSVD